MEGKVKQKLKLYYMESPKPMPVYWDVYEVQPNYIKHDRFLAFRCYPGMPISSGPIQVFIGSFLAMTGDEAIAQARMQHNAKGAVA